MEIVTNPIKKMAIYFAMFTPWVCLISAISGVLMWGLNIQDTWSTAAKVAVFISPISAFVGLYIPVILVQLFPRQAELYTVPRCLLDVIAWEIVAQIPALIVWGVILAVISPLCAAVYIVANILLITASAAAILMLTEESDEKTI